MQNKFSYLPAKRHPRNKDMATKLEQRSPTLLNLVSRPQGSDFGVSDTCPKDNQKRQVHNMHSSESQRKRKCYTEHTKLRNSCRTLIKNFLINRDII